jgi:hypothetical protein
MQSVACLFTRSQHNPSTSADVGLDIANTAAPSESWLTSAHNAQATHPDVQTQTYSTDAIAASVSTLAPRSAQRSREHYAERSV